MAQGLTLQEWLNFSAYHSCPLAFYRIPGKKEYEIICQLDTQPRYLKNLDALFEKKGFVISPWKLSKKKGTVFIQPDVIQKKGQIKANRRQFGKLKSLLKESKKSAGASFSLKQSKSIFAANQNEFTKQTETVINLIRSGELKKAIISRIHLLPKPKTFSIAQTFQQLCSNYPDAFVYFFYLPEEGCWMGATPELLLSLHDETLKTVSLAGTKKKSARKVRWGEKEKHEQGIVTTSILKLFEKCCGKGIKSTGPKTVSAGAFVHLKSEISVEARKKKMKRMLPKLLNDLHPTPAISGFPKKKSLALIKNLEKHDREYYTGFLGPVNTGKKNIRLYVNLRCMQVLKDKLALYVGAGITGDSVPELEWKETELKTKTIRNALN